MVIFHSYVSLPEGILTQLDMEYPLEITHWCVFFADTVDGPAKS